MAQKLNDIWFVYMLECANGKIYTGITTSVEKRFQKHVTGKGAKFTRSNLPSHILASKKCKGRSKASQLEWLIKNLKPLQKRALAKEWTASLSAKERRKGDFVKVI